MAPETPWVERTFHPVQWCGMLRLHQQWWRLWLLLVKEVSLRWSVSCIWVSWSPYLWSGLGQYRCEVCRLVFFNQHVKQPICRLGNRPNNPFFSKPFQLFIYPVWLCYGTWRVGVCTGVTERSNSICIGVPRGFPHPGLNTLAYCRKMSSAVSISSGESVCGVCRITSSTAFVSSGFDQLKI